MTIGILGGGQLGYMLALAGYPLGLHFRFLDPSPEAPVGRIAHRVTADYLDEHALEKFAHGLEVVTYEFENVPVDAARFLAERAPVYPPLTALEEAQNRQREKRLFQKLGIPTAEFADIEKREDFGEAVEQHGVASDGEDQQDGIRREGTVAAADAGGCGEGAAGIAGSANDPGEVCAV